MQRVFLKFFCKSDDWSAGESKVIQSIDEKKKIISALLILCVYWKIWPETGKLRVFFLLMDLIKFCLRRLKLALRDCWHHLLSHEIFFQLCTFNVESTLNRLIPSFGQTDILRSSLFKISKNSSPSNMQISMSTHHVVFKIQYKMAESVCSYSLYALLHFNFSTT